MTKERVIIDKDIQVNNEELTNLILGILEKGANYSIKSMSVSDQLKDLLLDVKKNLNNEEFKKMIADALNGSVKEGIDIENYNDYDFEEDDDNEEEEFEEEQDVLKMLKYKENKGSVINEKKIDLSDLSNIFKYAFKGGFPQLLSLAIEVATSSKKNNNIFSNYIDDFIGRIKTYVHSEQFKNKVSMGISKCSDKVEKFKGLCAAWYNAYDILNVDQIKQIANELKLMKNKVKFDNECLNENEVIQNVTDIVSKKGEKISKSRIEIFDNLHEL